MIYLKRENGRQVDHWVCYRIGRTLHQGFIQENESGQSNDGEMTKERYPLYIGMQKRMRHLAEEKKALGFRSLTAEEEAAIVNGDEGIDSTFLKQAIRYAWLMLLMGILLFVSPYTIPNVVAFSLSLYVWWGIYGKTGIPKIVRKYFHLTLFILTLLQVLSVFGLKNVLQPVYATSCILSSIVLLLLVVKHYLYPSKKANEGAPTIETSPLQEYSEEDW
ncbi:hypothetical protein [Exiguobacterium sp. H66]|uniref:hypothetical protein n=1 Tax=Exiguobacterium sp. H66 TaxID=2751208 RepID=UPI001BE57C22|nr:hypothetical protein [Exiguobacterium sp. H66]